MKDCAPTGSLTSNTDKYKIEDVKAKIQNITNQLIVAGSILSVGGIVFASILYVTALGSDEKVKKAKSALQFAVIGFVVMLLSFPIVNALVNLIYGIGSPTPATNSAAVAPNTSASKPIDSAIN